MSRSSALLKVNCWYTEFNKSFYHNSNDYFFTCSQMLFSVNGRINRREQETKTVVTGIKERKVKCNIK